MKTEKNKSQGILPFAEAEISFGERLNYLGLALMRIEADIYVANLCRWVFNVTKGGIDGALEKTLGQIASRPWGLCCSISTVQRAIRESQGILRIEQRSYRNGSQMPNLYSIDWEAVGEILRIRISRPNHPLAVGQADQPPSQIDQGASQADQLYKEITSNDPSNCPSFSNNSEPDRRTEPGPEFFCEGAPLVSQRIEIRRTSEKPRRRIAEEDTLRAELFEDDPALAGLAQRNVRSLPAGDFSSSVFREDLFTVETLRKTSALLEWFRRQLSSHCPILEGTAADFVLAKALAIYALALKAEEVKKNRVAVFCSKFSRREWRFAIPKLREARAEFDRLLAKYSDSLDCETWPPMDLVVVRAEISKSVETPKMLSEASREERLAAREAVQAARKEILDRKVFQAKP